MFFHLLTGMSLHRSSFPYLLFVAQWHVLHGKGGGKAYSLPLLTSLECPEFAPCHALKVTLNFLLEPLL